MMRDRTGTTVSVSLSDALIVCANAGELLLKAIFLLSKACCSLNEADKKASRLQLTFHNRHSHAGLVGGKDVLIWVVEAVEIHNEAVEESRCVFSPHGRTPR